MEGGSGSPVERALVAELPHLIGGTDPRVDLRHLAIGEQGAAGEERFFRGACAIEAAIGTLVLLVITLSAYIGITRYSGRIITNLISVTNLK